MVDHLFRPQYNAYVSDMLKHRVVPEGFVTWLCKREGDLIRQHPLHDEFLAFLQAGQSDRKRQVTISWPHNFYAWLKEKTNGLQGG